jgi:hypothetical protein
MLTALAARTAQMTEIDLIAAGPWILFCIVLAAVCFRLARSRRAASQRNPAGHEPAVHRDDEEASCPQKNTTGRRR